MVKNGKGVPIVEGYTTDYGSSNKYCAAYLSLWTELRSKLNDLPYSSYDAGWVFIDFRFEYNLY